MEPRRLPADARPVLQQAGSNLVSHDLPDSYVCYTLGRIFVLRYSTRPMEKEHVILVDENDSETGTMEKMEAHRKGELHRAVSVFILNSEGKWLLHKRATTKYHSGGLWTNACCSHPRPGEDTSTAASRRLKEEMGLSCELKFLFSFQYRADVGDELVEHELDHVYLGRTDSAPTADPSEASDWSFFTPEEITGHIDQSPERFTTWFRMIFERVKSLS